MASQREKTVVYAAGVAQGIALVIFPAASTILTDPAEYDVSSTQYGTLFRPQVVAAVMGGWSFVVARHRPGPACVHPQLGHGAG